MRQGAELTLDLVFARTPLAQALRGSRVGVPGHVALAHELGIGRGERVGLVALILQRLELAFQFGQLGGRGARPVELVRLLAQRVEPVADLGKSGARREQQLAEIATAREDRLAALLQALVVEREHHMESLAIDAGELRRQQALVERPVVGVDEAVLVALEARNLVRPPAKFEPRADPHRVIGVPVRDAGASPSRRHRPSASRCRTEDRGSPLRRSTCRLR